MDFTGVIVRFPTNRLLTDDERTYQLKQQRRLDITPRYQLSVIRMNSTYLESVDKWYGWKGLVTAIAMTVILMFALSGGAISVLMLLEAGGWIPITQPTDELLVFGLLSGALTLTMIGLSVHLLRKESFAYTHYPLRFNRKTRMVYAWRIDGTALAVPWEVLFFTLAYSAGQWEVRGHVLAADKATVLETIALSYRGVLLSEDRNPTKTQYSDQDLVRAHWEFIRRYMEEGPYSVSGQVEFCMPLDGRRETAKAGMHRVFANFSGGSWITILLMAPFCIAIGLARILAMRTGKIPEWPPEIEAACAVEEGDPYAITGDAEGHCVPVYPEATCPADVNPRA
jgi:hypothetical protein